MANGEKNHMPNPRFALLLKSSILTLMVGAIMVLPNSAIAQDSDEAIGVQSEGETDYSRSLDTVYVTARRFEESLQDVPVAVSAFSQDQLDNLVVENAIDLSKLTAGLQTDACSGSRTTCFRPNIRGYGTTFGSGEASVIAYFAEVPNIPPSYYDLQNLQVLKGPQGTLFGETAVGGAILFEPKRPDNEFGGYLRVQGGNYDFRSAEFAVGGPIIEDKVLFRLAGLVRQREGFVTSIPSYAGGVPVDLDNIDTSDFRASLIVRPTTNLENYSVVSRSYLDTNGTSNPVWYFDPRFIPGALRNLPPSAVPQMAAGFEFYAGYAPRAGATWGELLSEAYLRQTAAGPFKQFVNTDRRRETVNTSIVNQTKWDISDNLTLRNIFGMNWSKTAGAGLLEVDGVDLPVVDTGGLVALNGVSDDEWTGGYPNRTWTNEIQLLGSLFEDRLNFQTGVYYRDTGNREFQPSSGAIIVYANPAGNPASAAICTDPDGLAATAPCSLLTRTESTSAAIYGQATWAVLDTLNITGGVRRTTDERSIDTAAGELFTRSFGGFDFPISVIDTPRQPGSQITTLEVPETSRTTYNVTLDWKPVDDVLVYITNRTGYKGGGVNQNTDPTSPDRTFGPETITNYEIGVKADWSLGGVLIRTNIAAYKDEYSDVQRSTLIPGTASTVTQNLANIDNRGLEFEATAVLTDWFELSGYYALIDSGYAEWIEESTCAGNQFRPQCAGLAVTTPVTIDHGEGILTVAGDVTRFEPDLVANASRHRWSLQPTIFLEPFTGQDISLSANVYSRTKYSPVDVNYSVFAGTIATPTPVGIFETADARSTMVKGYTLVDLRADWRNIGGSAFSAALSVTNVTDEVYMAGYGNPLQICGCIGAVVGEPRMGFIELGYEF